MHPRVERRGPAGVVFGTPPGPDGVDLDRRVRRAGFGQAGERHHAAVAQGRDRRVPASVRHVLHVREPSGRRVEEGAPRLTQERVIFEVTAVDEHAPVGQRDHSVAEHVPRHALPDDRSGRRVPHGGFEVGIRRFVSRSGDDQYLAVVQQRHVDRVDRHQIREGVPLSLRLSVRLAHRKRAQRCRDRDHQQEPQDSCRSCLPSVHARSPRCFTTHSISDSVVR